MMNRKISLRRTLVFAAITVMLLATTAFAVGKIYSTGSHSNNREAFFQLPAASELQSLMGASPKVIEQFNTGYKFEKGVVAHTQDMDENGNVLGKHQALDFSYASGANHVSLFMEKQKPGNTPPPNSTISTYGGITLYALDYISKTIPAGYVKTEQEKLDEAAGRVVFGYNGGDTTETTTVQMLFWDDGGVSYSLMTCDNPLTSGELTAMAKQMIDKE